MSSSISSVRTETSHQEARMPYTNSLSMGWRSPTSPILLYTNPRPRPSVDSSFTLQTSVPSRYDYPVSYFADMAVSNNPDEMEEFQKLSDQYRPELEGPLVGNRLPLTDLVTEYAQADPAYVTKTQALASSYDAYRRIKGDGQCGWRGAVFGYFEVLLKSGDLGLVLQEHARIQSYSEMMKNAGMAYEILEDMFEVTFDLFREIQKALETGDNTETVLINTFNEQNISDSIVYHFKTMTSAYMAVNEEDFQPFLEMQLHEYRQLRIDPAQQEIDQIGLQGLTSGVIAPSGTAVEVLYLDRSTGDEVTPHNFAPHVAANATIRLLYRPGHYDIIYKSGPLYQQPLTAFPVHHVPTPQLDYDDPEQLSRMEQAALPGSFYVRDDDFYQHQHYSPHAPRQNSNPYQDFEGSCYVDATFAPVDIYDHLRVAHELSPPSVRSQQQDYFQQPQQQPQTTMPPTSMPLSPTSGPQSGHSSTVPTSPSGQPSSPTSELQIRFNDHMFVQPRQRSIPLDPNTSASFAQNRNYYRNSNFDPECWLPEEGYNR